MQHKIEPNTTCTIILRQIRGGNLNQEAGYAGKCQMSLEIEKTCVRLIKEGKSGLSASPVVQRYQEVGHFPYQDESGEERLGYLDLD